MNFDCGGAGGAGGKLARERLSFVEYLVPDKKTRKRWRIAPIIRTLSILSDGATTTELHMVTAQTSGEAQSKSESVGITDTFHLFSSNVSVCPDTFGGVSPECVGKPDTLRFPLHICRLEKLY